MKKFANIQKCLMKKKKRYDLFCLVFCNYVLAIHLQFFFIFFFKDIAKKQETEFMVCGLKS